MQDHQMLALIDELRGHPYDGLSADDAFAYASSTGMIKKRGTQHFVSSRQFMTLPSEVASRLNVYVIKDEILERAERSNPTGVPGMPNKLRREWFNEAWKKARK